MINKMLYATPNQFLLVVNMLMLGTVIEPFGGQINSVKKLLKVPRTDIMCQILTFHCHHTELEGSSYQQVELEMLMPVKAGLCGGFFFLPAQFSLWSTCQQSFYSFFTL